MGNHGMIGEPPPAARSPMADRQSVTIPPHQQEASMTTTETQELIQGFS